MVKPDWTSSTLPLLAGSPKYDEVFLAFAYYKVYSVPSPSDPNQIRRIAYRIIGTNCKTLPGVIMPYKAASSVGNAKVEQIKSPGRDGVLSPAVFIVRARFKANSKTGNLSISHTEVLGVLDLESGKGQVKFHYIEFGRMVALQTLTWCLSLAAVLSGFWARYYWGDIAAGFGIYGPFVASIYWIWCWVDRRVSRKLYWCARLVMDRLEIDQPKLDELWHEYHARFIADEEAMRGTDSMGFDFGDDDKPMGTE
jgi:hypothetical protein